ncbi:MAG TPA: hypothetical protein VGQ83_05400 [Polyangia bacterium]|jgi:hypothetical protein
MTKLLQKAFDEAQRLPEGDQDSLARWLLRELESDRRWEALLAESPETLEELADEALGEHTRGRTQRLDPDRL